MAKTLNDLLIEIDEKYQQREADFFANRVPELKAKYPTHPETVQEAIDKFLKDELTFIRKEKEDAKANYVSETAAAPTVIAGADGKEVTPDSLVGKSEDFAIGGDELGRTQQSIEANKENIARLQKMSTGKESVARREGQFQQEQLRKQIASRLASQRGFDPGMAAQALAVEGQGLADISGKSSVAASAEKLQATKDLITAQDSQAKLWEDLWKNAKAIGLQAINQDMLAFRTALVDKYVKQGMTVEQATERINGMKDDEVKAETTIVNQSNAN